MPINNLGAQTGVPAGVVLSLNMPSPSEHDCYSQTTGASSPDARIMAPSRLRIEPPEMPPALLDLPPFPAIAIRVLQLVSKDDVRHHALDELIRSDPALSTELLKLANSPIFGVRATIKTTLQAAVLLGFERVRGLVLTVCMRLYFGNYLEVPILRACWRHSLACAIVAEELARIGLMDKDVAYTAGLIHDIGRLALAVLHRQEYASFLESAEKMPGDILFRERAMFGIDHCQAGHALVESWHLPQEFLQTTASHHELWRGDRLDMLGAVQFACLISEALGFGVGAVDQPRNYADIVKDLPEHERNKFPSDAGEFTFRIASKINSIEVF